MTTHGAEAVNSGSFLEEVIEREFNRRGVKSYFYSQMAENGDIFEPHFLLKNVPYTTMYKRRGFSPFLYRRFAEPGGDVRILCFNQNGSGSVDEKFPYHMKNAIDCMPEPYIWFVIEGEGAKPEGIEWLRQTAAKVHAKIIKVMNLSQARLEIKDITAKAVREAAE